MSVIYRDTWFQRVCPHNWQQTGETVIHDAFEPTLLFGVQTTKVCRVCRAKFMSDIR